MKHVLPKFDSPTRARGCELIRCPNASKVTSPSVPFHRSHKPPEPAPSLVTARRPMVALPPRVDAAEDGGVARGRLVQLLVVLQQQLVVFLVLLVELLVMLLVQLFV